MQIQSTRIPPSPHVAIDFAGTGTPVIFLHGIGGNRSNWSDQLSPFARRYLAIAWDMRGYGASDDYDGVFELDAVCGDLCRVLEHFGRDAAVLVGLSMGGMIAQEFYRRFPKRVLALVLADTNAGPGGDFSPGDKAEFLRLRREPLLRGLTPRDIAPQLVDVLAGPDADTEVRARLEQSISGLRTESYLKALDAVVDFDSADVLARIAVPVLLVCGGADRVTPPAGMRAMEKAITGARYVELERAGHLSNIEQPEAFNRIALDFLHGALGASEAAIHQ